MATHGKGLRRNWIRIPLTAFLLFIAWIGIPQGWETLSTEDDWSDDYLRATAEIVGGREDIRSSTSSSTSAYYRCYLIIEYILDGEAFLAEPMWLLSESYVQGRGEACAADRVGEKVEIWIVTGIEEPFVLEPGNKASQPLSGIVNIATGLLALFGVERLWLAGRYRRYRG
jgi:hypothetical protein